MGAMASSKGRKSMSDGIVTMKANSQRAVLIAVHPFMQSLTNR
jgi:hypothetical protein